MPVFCAAIRFSYACVARQTGRDSGWCDRAKGFADHTSQKTYTEGGRTMLKVIEIFEKLVEICDMIIAWLSE